jgi:hypothetical protein
MLPQLFRPLCVAALVSLCVLPAQASDDKAKRPTFDWFANAAPALPKTEAAARKQAALLKARALSKGATWVCSPAGSGQKARCHKG